MGPKGRSGPKVKVFKTEWLKEEIDGIAVRSWCVSDPTDPGRAKCLVCVPPRDKPALTFSIGEGFSAIRTHSKGKNHVKRYEEKDANQNQEGLSQMYIETAMRNQEEQNKNKRKLEEQVLASHIQFSYMLHVHGLPSKVFTCFSEIVPKLFPDSEIAKMWGVSGGKGGLRASKGDYFCTHGLHPFLHEELLQVLRSNYFSLNIDESSVNKTSQVDVNVSFNYEGVGYKRNLTTISMEEGTSAPELANAFFLMFDSFDLPLKNCPKVSADGCKTILGEIAGFLALLRRQMPWLPHFGGCSCHDCANILKHAVPKLSPNLVPLYESLHSYLGGSQSLHRQRSYEKFCHERGLEPTNIPKYIEVRFTSIIKMATWMERDQRCIYQYFTWLLDEIKEGRHKDITASEQTILREFMANYIEIRLYNMFLIDVSKPINLLIKHFEQDKPKIFETHEQLRTFLYTFMSKFLKNAGLDPSTGDIIKAKDLLNVDYRDPNLRLSKRNVFLGSKVEEFLESVGLTRESPELGDFFKGVYSFFMEACQYAFKYFSPPLRSKLLHHMKVLDPKSFLSFPLSDLQSNFRYVAEGFDNIIKKTEIPDLLDQVAALKSHSNLKELVNNPEYSPTFIFYKLESSSDGRFKLLGRLGSGLLTIHNASTAVERDFSVQNALLTDPRKTSQTRLQARLNLKTHMYNFKKKCGPCNEVKNKLLLNKAMEYLSSDDEEEEEKDSDADEDDDNANKKEKVKGEKATHCHCPLFEVTPDMMAFMNGGQPARRYKTELKERREKQKADKIVLATKAAEDKGQEKTDMKKELAKLRRKCREFQARLIPSSSVPTQKRSAEEEKQDRVRKKRELQEKRVEQKKNAGGFLLGL